MWDRMPFGVGSTSGCNGMINDYAWQLWFSSLELTPIIMVLGEKPREN